MFLYYILMNYYEKYLKYKNKYLELKITMEDLLKEIK
jgi:hypothetical protein